MAQDALLEALLARVPRQGWTRAALEGALRDIGDEDVGDEAGGESDGAPALFPGGAPEMIDACAALADRWMAADAAAADMSGLRTAGRVHAVVALRLARLRPHREALRRAAGYPGHRARLMRTVDAIWHAAGDRLEGASRHTKRATLAAVYASTLLFWLHREEESDAAALDFMDRRLNGVARIGKMRQCLASAFKH